MLVVLAVADLTRRLGDGIEDLAVEQLELVVGESRGFLHGGEGRDESREVAQLDAGNREVLHRPHRLNPVQRRCRNIALTKKIALASARAAQLETWRVPR
jgi:hypothetical protein